jgi:hypothetical protein
LLTIPAHISLVSLQSHIWYVLGSNSVIPFGLTSFAHLSMHASISGLSLWSDFNHSSFSIHKYAYNPHISPCSQPRHLCSLVDNDQSYLFGLTSVAHPMCTWQLQLLVIPSGLTSVAHLSAQTSMQGMHTHPLVAYSGICAHSSTFSGHISLVSLQSLIPSSHHSFGRLRPSPPFLYLSSTMVTFLHP